MRILFIGSVAFSASALNKLIQLKANIVGVCAPKYFQNNADYVDLSPIAKAANISFHLFEDINSSTSFEWISSKNPDIIFCFGLSSLIKHELLALPPKGVLGYHPAALPLNRGRHPLIWALALGLTETASTFFFMNDAADAGDIISQVPVEILPNENAGLLYSKITKVAMLQIEQLLALLEGEAYKVIRQDESRANLWRKRSELDGHIDWRMSSASIHNLVRALAKPYPGADFLYKQQYIKVWSSRIMDCNNRNYEPGKVIYLEGEKPIVKCGEGAICLLELEPEIKISVGDYL